MASTTEEAMETFRIRNGSHLVRSNATLPGRWASRLYVNDGETATLVCAKHKTREGAERWARKVLASPAAARDHAEEALGS
jgi:hypothetical protein